LRSYGELAGAINLRIETDNVCLGIDSAVPCGLILNELISNSLKHAFPSNGNGLHSAYGRDGVKGEIRVELHAHTGHDLCLMVSDNGAGFSPDLDFRSTSSLGLQLVNTLVNQLDGTIELDNSRGTAFQITFAAS
jgi:two-component sensor histidine kinase